MLILGAEHVRQSLKMTQAIGVMKVAFAALKSGRASVPLRTHVDVPEHRGVVLVMSARLDPLDLSGVAVKVVSVFPDNTQLGMDTTVGIVLLIDSTTGVPVAVLEGGTLTAVRTGAVTGAATDLMACEEASTLALIGAGRQARTQVEAMCAVRPIETVWVYDVVTARAEDLVENLVGQGHLAAGCHVARSAREAVCQADIVCTTTTSTQPVFNDADLRPGTHINAVGAYRPNMQEIPSETVARARVVVDSREAAWSEAGDLIIPLTQGIIGRDHVHADLGDLVLDHRLGRENRQEVTLFKTVGVAVADAAAARVAVRNAMEATLGVTVTL